MKTLLFLVKGFETMEFSVLVDVMGWARNDYGYDVPVITCGFQKEVISTFNIPVLVEKTINEIDVNDYDALAIPGGFEEYGFYEEAYDEKFLNLSREFDKHGKIIATICVAALPVGKSGVLNGACQRDWSIFGCQYKDDINEITEIYKSEFERLKHGDKNG